MRINKHVLSLITLTVLFFTVQANSRSKEKKLLQKISKVYFISPKNGESVEAKFKIKFGLAGMKLRPAGEDVKDRATGHHHLIIDGDFIEAGQVIPTDDTHKHFGKAQTETEITLPKGKHKLTLQLADGAHLSYGKLMSSTIEVIVK